MTRRDPGDRLDVAGTLEVIRDNVARTDGKAGGCIGSGGAL